MAECSTKYNAAKDAGTLGGQNWNQFRKAQCGTDATATDTTPAKADTTSAATADDAAPGLTAKECSAKYQDGAQERQVPDGDLEEVCRRDSPQGSHAHLPRNLLCQQGRQYAGWPQVDPEGRRLLQRLQRQAEELIRGNVI
jgi:hypothetical protein